MTQKEKDDVYKEYNKKVFYYFIGKGVNETDAEDLCANVFVKFYDTIDSFDSEKSSPSTWIYRISHNTLIDFFRMKKQFSELDEEIEYEDHSADDILNNETLTELAHAIMKLDERSRALVVLVYYDGNTLKESAEVLKMSYSNAKLVMKKALAELKDYMESGV